ncbi:MAG TPA: hypothetical protein EYP67_04405, partial [Methanosarcinales archaeon]|nr:hypothetical protein [Methanosarcinales archaeon]
MSPEEVKRLVDRLEDEYAGEVTFIRINVTERPDHAGEFGVSGLPAMIAISGKSEEGYAKREISGFTEETGLRGIIASDGDDGVWVAATSTTCNSCSDCTKKLNGDYDTVVLTTDLTNVKGSCITLGANNVVFDGGGNRIDGDDTGEFESGIVMTGKTGNKIKNCVITDFESGITLYGSSKNEIYDNKISSNYHDGIWISDSDSNNIHDNLIEDNGKYGVYFASDSNDNILSDNTVCSNPTDIYDADKNSGDDNACETTHNWNDVGTTGCTYDCTTQKPDLVITDIWDDGGTICYEIKNIGDGTALEGHYTTLFVDGEYQIKEQVDVDLSPGASVKRCFDIYTWNCTLPGDNVEVCADYGNFVDEISEKNNCREETWTCASTGGAIIYHADYGAGIWRMNPDGSENTQLSDHGWFAEYSPDNARIAFGEYYQSGIWVMDSDGTGQVQLTSSGNAPTWSPDSTKIAYHVGGTTVTERRIWVMDADGSNAQKLSESPGDFPAWSPDGTTIAYSGEADNDIRLIHPDGTGDTQLCAQSRDPAWSPDGEKMAYRSLTDGCIWTMNADGSGKMKVSTSAGKYPEWSPDGTKIAYEDDTGIWVIDADGTGEHLINQGGHAPDWTSQAIVEELPDLVITDLWNEEGDICYQIRNIGEATAPKGHYTSLFIDNEERSNDLIDSEIKPGERLKRCFDYGWQCSPPDDAITVCADHGDDVNEDSEGNNCRKETWKCDVIPPKIISGPAVSGITQSSVTIAWTTNEDSDSLVRFGRTAGKYEDQKSGLKLTQEHTIILIDLLPSTTYHYFVQSTDASENTVVSKDGFFETLPLPDDEPPVLHALNITRGKGAFLYYELSADVSDNTGVGRVEFYLDDRLIGTDYSEPYLCYLVPAYTEMSREEFFEEHTVEAVVFDVGGMVFESSVRWGPPYEVMSVTAKILTPCCSHPHPYPGYLYTDDGVVPDGTTVDIIVRAAEYELGEERPGTPACPGDIPPPMREIIPHPVQRVRFYLDGTLVGTSTTPSSTYEKYIYTHILDASGLVAGDYEIEARAIATDGTMDNATCTVTVAEGTPYVMPARSVSRIGNYFEVTLTLSNPGTASALVDTITDHAIGFQAVGKSAEEYTVTTDYTTGSKDCEILIDLFTDTTDTITLSPGEFFRVVYSVVPILYEDATDYSIGEETVIRYYDPSGRLDDNTVTSPSSRTLEGEWFPSTVDNAIETSDYLIATNPARLFTHYTDADVEELLPSVAGLAEEKNGVLGYLDTYSRSTFKNLIEPGGDWSSRLATDWTSEGYLLIVGETEIVPSRDIFD